MFDKLKEASGLVKIATVCVLASAVLGIIFGFVFLDQVSEGLDFISSYLPFDMGMACIIYILVYYAIDFIVAFGLTRLSRWAYSLATWWGIFAAISIAMSIRHPSAMFVPYVLSVVAAVCLFIRRSEFAKK